MDVILRILRDKAASKSVGFSLVYCDSDDSWYGTINSQAPSECWVGKNRSLQTAIDSLTEALEKL